ncbi:hypothetical protein [Pontibacter sp. SGAir0037]|uniref:hypothetical protein n=1 Tax=Pontibacter sp. SGAir0037 TaxID=2571030 RepID=UPI0010CCDB36|nr:hypothetical protein [Pontibacter sp. SGAir0037]QCR22358.1 hypothetical protein C1N53_08410 [Pontibacter sp. SGAir0037]
MTFWEEKEGQVLRNPLNKFTAQGQRKTKKRSTKSDEVEKMAHEVWKSDHEVEKSSHEIRVHFTGSHGG